MASSSILFSFQVSPESEATQLERLINTSVTNIHKNIVPKLRQFYLNHIYVKKMKKL